MRLILLAFLFLTLNGSAQINPNNITIARDSFGVPHIFAKTDPEVAYGLAWAHAEDDFSSLQQVVLPAKGKMGKALGKAGAAGDYAFALFRCKEITEERWNTLSPAYKRLLDGYVQGINEYAMSHKDQWVVKGLFPITVKDYMAASVLALTVFNGADDALKRIFNNKIWTVSEMSTTKGSNTFAVNGSKTTTGEAYLLVNAHQPNTGPQAFYEAHVCSEEGWNAMGGLLAGGTSILHGVNEQLGWAHTVNFCDRSDVFQLEMNPANKDQYKFDGQWVNLEKKTIRLQIKGIPVAVKRTVYWSKYGATMKNKQGVFSIRLGANMRIGAMQQWYEMNKAKNFTEFYTVLQQQELSMFNIMYADRSDTIFYISNALMPVRNPDPVYNWKRTVPGNTSKTLWTEFRPLTALPQYINPQSGFLYNTNHAPFLATATTDNLDGRKFAATDGWEQYDLNRSARFRELFPQQGKVSFEQFKAIKFDRRYPARFYFPYQLDTLYLMQTDDYPELKTVLTHFQQWDREGLTDRKGAAVFLLLYEELKKKLNGQSPRPVTKAEAVAALTNVKTYLLKNFKTEEVTLGELQKLVRGADELPLWGLPDQLAPQWTEGYKNGKLKSIGGDGYIIFIRFSKDQLPKIETVNMYGASAVPGNPHFADQVPLYLQQTTKTMTLDKTEVLTHAIRTYHPGAKQ
jgi:acyl-homoserine-lactone acylase